MGQKVNPHGARVGVIYNWSTRWYAGKKDFANNLVEDYKLREMLKEKLLFHRHQSTIDIERVRQPRDHQHLHREARYDHRPRRRGHRGPEEGRGSVHWASPANINIMEIKVPDTNAQLVAENIAQQLEKRISFRRAMKQSIQRALTTPAPRA